MMLTDIVKHLIKSDSIGVISHVVPDGDALGSSRALGLALEKMGKRVIIIKNDQTPQKYNFLPGVHLVVESDSAPFNADTLAVLDCGDIERLGSGILHFKKAGTVLNIDHHISNTMFGNLNIVDANAAATAEIIYQVIKLMGVTVDLDIATCLFTAIAADTGCFRYDSTTSVTHSIAGEMISIGVKSNSICNGIFNTRTYQQTKMLGKAIESIKLFHEGRTAVMSISKAVMHKAGCGQEDLEGIIEFARDIKGVEVAALIRETETGDIKVGLRSNEYVDTSAIAAFFSGGGHKKASGYTVNSSMEDAEFMLLEQIKKKYR